MPASPTYRDIFLLPGALAFGPQDLRLSTLLGSCVSVVVWHPQLLLGGMCHYLLPQRAHGQDDSQPDGRYATDALHMLQLRMKSTAEPPARFVAYIVGGARCIPDNWVAQERVFDIGQRNIEAADAWCTRLRLPVQQRQVGGAQYRHVTFEVGSGTLAVRQGDPSLQPTFPAG